MRACGEDTYLRYGAVRLFGLNDLYLARDATTGITILYGHVGERAFCYSGTYGGLNGAFAKFYGNVGFAGTIYVGGHHGYLVDKDYNGFDLYLVSLFGARLGVLRCRMLGVRRGWTYVLVFCACVVLCGLRGCGGGALCCFGFRRVW